jgi:hypothetical protein
MNNITTYLTIRVFLLTLLALILLAGCASSQALVVTAYFPVNHPSLPDGPEMSDVDYQALMQNLNVRLEEATRTLNDSRVESDLRSQSREVTNESVNEVYNENY